MLSHLAVLAASVALVSADCTNPDYTQIGGDSGDCFRVYNISGLTYTTALSKCRSDGGSLASIHNDIEDVAISQMVPYTQSALIGLQCVNSTTCSWADGSPYDYTEFNGGTPIVQYGQCATISAADSKWYSSSCTAAQTAFVCRMYSYSGNDTSCGDYTPYNGGCAKLKTYARNYADAEEDCNIDGGHLVSIHDALADTFYTSLGGNNSAVLIGLKTTSGGVYSWSDGTKVDFASWAPIFPDDWFGSCVQLLITSDLGAYSQWSNVPCDQALPYLCYKDGSEAPTLAPLNCPAMQLVEEAGKVYSPGFPVSFPAGANCEYLLAGKTGTSIQLHFPRFQTDSGSTLSLYRGISATVPTYTLSGSVNASTVYTFDENIVKMVFKSSASAVGGGWEAEFTSSS